MHPPGRGGSWGYVCLAGGGGGHPISSHAAPVASGCRTVVGARTLCFEKVELGGRGVLVTGPGLTVPYAHSSASRSANPGAARPSAKRRALRTFKCEVPHPTDDASERVRLHIGTCAQGHPYICEYDKQLSL